MLIEAQCSESRFAVSLRKEYLDVQWCRSVSPAAVVDSTGVERSHYSLQLAYTNVGLLQKRNYQLQARALEIFFTVGINQYLPFHSSASL